MYPFYASTISLIIIITVSHAIAGFFSKKKRNQWTKILFTLSIPNPNNPNTYPMPKDHPLTRTV